jgi:hypothetical protein
MTNRPPEEPLDQHDDERVVHALRDSWDAAPEVDRAALWSAVESRLEAQQRPWYRSLYHQLLNLFAAPMRLAALGVTAAVVAAVLFLSGVFDDQTPASAAVVQQVAALSTTTEAAVGDGTLSNEEIAELRTRAVELLREIDRDNRSLQQLTPEELKLVVDTLLLVGDDLDDFLEDDHGEFEDDFEEALESIHESSMRASDFRRERGDGDDEDDRDDEERSGLSVTATPTATASVTATPRASASAAGDDEHDDDEHPEATPAEGTPEASAATSIPATPGTYTAPAGAAGSVTFSYDGEQLQLDSVAAAEGWTSTVDHDRGGELKVRFATAGQELTLEIERHDDVLRIETKTSSTDSEHDD